jgi:hypothetical protein
MNQERGSALRLLYQIKLALDRHFSKTKRSVTGLRPGTVQEKLKKSNELTRSLPKLHKQFGVEGPTFKHQHKPLALVEQKLLKFEYARAELEKKAKNDHQAEVNMLQSMQQTKRQEAMNNLKENQKFMKEWFAEGHKNW